MKVIRHNPAAITLEIPSKSTQPLSLMLSSDIHYDSACCDLDLFTKHLKLAEKLQAPVLIAGDLLDAMQGKHDPRRTPEDLKKQYKVSAYYDAIVKDTTMFLSKFDIPLYILALGNHETGVLTHAGTNLLQTVAYQLRVEHKKEAVSMGYWGYIRIMFRYKKGMDNASKIIYFHHGISGNAPVTKGVIQVNRQSTYLYDADFVLNGHNHAAYLMPIQVERLNQKTMKVYTETVFYLRTPGYKKSPADSMKVWGFGAEKHRAPLPRGCMFLNMEYVQKQGIETDILQKIS